MTNTNTDPDYGKPLRVLRYVVVESALDEAYIKVIKLFTERDATITSLRAEVAALTEWGSALGESNQVYQSTIREDDERIASLTQERDALREELEMYRAADREPRGLR